MKSFFAAILFLLSVSANAFPLICRGPVSFDSAGASFSATQGTGGLITVSFKKSPTAAGQSGASLAPGTCAWVDRPVSANEPGTFVIRKLWNHRSTATDREVLVEIISLSMAMSALAPSVLNPNGYFKVEISSTRDITGAFSADDRVYGWTLTP